MKPRPRADTAQRSAPQPGQCGGHGWPRGAVDPPTGGPRSGVHGRLPDGLLPLMDELLQRCALRHQLREAAPQHHERQDGQQVVGAAVGQGVAAGRLRPAGLLGPQSQASPARGPVLQGPGLHPGRAPGWRSLRSWPEPGGHDHGGGGLWPGQVSLSSAHLAPSPSARSI